MLQRYGSLTAACKEILRLLVKRYQQYRSKPISLKVKPYNFLLFLIVDCTKHHNLGFSSSFQQQLQKVWDFFEKRSKLIDLDARTVLLCTNTPILTNVKT